jgi:hypothetical protein
MTKSENFSWSYSAYSTAVSCLRKFKLIFIDKLVPDSPESGDMAFGSALHSAINACLTGHDGADTFDIYWNSYRGKELEYGRYKWPELKELGQEFIRKFSKHHAPKYNLKFAEQRLYGDYKGVRLEGTLDYFGDYCEKQSLRDFKTSGRNYDSHKQDCALQLYLYSYLYLQNNPTARIDTLGYTVFNKGTGSIQDLTWEFREEDMYKALDELVEYCKLDKGSYPKNYNACLDYNRKCQFFDICHKGDGNG